MIEKIREIIVAEYLARRQKNALYSKRAFARDLGVPASTLSEFMNHGTEFGSRNLTRVLEFLSRVGKNPYGENQFESRACE